MELVGLIPTKNYYTIAVLSVTRFCQVLRATNLVTSIFSFSVDPVVKVLKP